MGTGVLEVVKVRHSHEGPESGTNPEEEEQMMAKVSARLTFMLQPGEGTEHGEGGWRTQGQGGDGKKAEVKGWGQEGE